MASCISAGLVPFDEVGRPAVAAQQLLQFLVRDAGQDGRVGDLVAVEVQDRQHRAVGGRIEKLVGMPGRGQRPGLRLAVADDAGDDQIGIVEHRPERMAERIAQFAALVDRARALRRGVAGNAAGKRELQEELLQPGLVLADVGIDLAVGALEIGVAHDGRAAVAGAGDVDHVEVVFLDDPVQVHVDEVLPGGRAPVPEQHVLHVRERQRPLQQRIVVEIDLADRQVVGGAPVGIHLVEQFRGKRFCLHGSLLLFLVKTEHASIRIGDLLSDLDPVQCLFAFARGETSYLAADDHSSELQPPLNPSGAANHAHLFKIVSVRKPKAGVIPQRRSFPSVEIITHIQ